uniref:Uncharacterized protein n=1 Tax=Tanacetum cinerariifolium TaxID=118510 RepID=A0A6L2LJV2_TANCI|nr:hypothetical protein [Tanacetum cinerariifolium]
MQSFSLGENDVEARLRTMGSFVRTASGSVDITDPSFLDKLKFYGFMSPQISGANSLIGYKSSKASLVPTPKLISSSRGISNNPLQLHSAIHKSEDKELDQTKEVSSFLKGVIGDDNSHPTETSGLPYFVGPQVIPDSIWRPRGVLVAHLQEHRSAVNDIFVAFCATMLHGSAQVVVGSSDGTIHMFSVNYIYRGFRSVVEKYSGIANVKKNNIGEGAILALLNYSSGSGDGKMIMYSIQNYGIHLRDTRENSRMSFSQVGENDAEALTFTQSQNA